MATAHSLLKYFLLGRFSGDASPVNFITGSFRGSVETVAAGHADVGATLLPLSGVERFDVVPLGLVEEVFAAHPEALVRWGVPADRDVWTYA